MTGTTRDGFALGDLSAGRLLALVMPVQAADSESTDAGVERSALEARHGIDTDSKAPDLQDPEVRAALREMERRGSDQMDLGRRVGRMKAAQIHQRVLAWKRDLAGTVTDSELSAPERTRAAMTGMIRGIGAGVIAAFMVIVVLSQVYSLDIVSQGSGPFANLTSDYVDYGTAAMSLVGIGLIVGGAGYAMSMFNGWGSGR